MKKVIAIVSVVAACTFNAAHAQSSVTLYGIVDNGQEYQNAGAGFTLDRKSVV